MADKPSEEHAPSRTAFLVVVLGVSVLAFVAGLVIVAAQSDGRTDEPSPSEVASRYFDAFVKGDCDDLIEFGTKRTWSDNGSMGEHRARRRCRDVYTIQRRGVPTRYDRFKVVTENEDSAEVEMLVIFPDGRTIPERVSLRKEKDAWKVDRPGA